MKFQNLTRTFTLGLTCGLLFLGSAQLCSAEISKEFENFASKIKYFGTNDFLYGFREKRFNPRDNAKAIQEFAENLNQNNFSIQEILPLLKYNNPKVKTLALIALYDKEDPRILPEVFNLIDNQEKTFPSLVPIARAYGINDNEPDITEEQTVGKVATAILNFYLRRAGYFYGPKGTTNQPGFEDYWEKHSKRIYCASWFGVKLDRAGWATSPTPPERVNVIHNLRLEIDRVPEPDHTWILLWLHGESGSDALISEDELINMLRSVGPDSLIKLLQRRIPSSDPDLQAPYTRMCLFVLQHT